MKIVCWNVNSVKARGERLLAMLARHQPDVVCLQELKVTEEHFPFEALRAAGYRAAVNCQKAYNGVAILAKSELLDVARNLDDAEDDPQARLIAATVDGVRIICVYVPNGSTVGSDKYIYKLAWMRRLKRYLERHDTPQQPLVLCGDFNVAPRQNDVAKPEAWDTSVLFHPEVRQALAEIAAWGLVDVLAKHHPEGGIYSWWDYRMLGFAKNNGLRIDLVYATDALACRSVSATVDRDERRGMLPSDHAPVIVEFR